MMQSKKLIFIEVITMSILTWSALVHAAAPGVHLGYNVGRQKVTTKGVLILEQELETIQRDRGTSVIWETALAYGITRWLGARIFIPVFLKRKLDGFVARGVSDISLEAIFLKFLKPYNVLVGTVGVFFPTGSIDTQPRLGTGNYNIIMTADWLHSSPHWYCGFILRPIISIKRKERKPGSILNFQYLFGPKFELCNSKLPMALIWELDGVFRKQSKFNGIKDNNTGGTLIVTGPLISYKKGTSIIQARFLFPIVQNFRGQQPKIDFISGLNMQFYF